MDNKPNVLFIHGAWVNGRCWDPIKLLLEQQGYSCAAPNWPHKDKPNAPELAKIGIAEILEHYQSIIRQYATPPVLIGHSFGGLFTQLLLNQGYGSAGIVLNSAPTKELLPLYLSVWQTNLPVVRQFLGSRLMRLTPKEFGYSFAHLSTPAEQQKLYDTYVMNETPRIFRQALTAPLHNLTKVDYAKPAKPLLFLAGEKDLLCPAKQNKINCAQYRSDKVTYQRLPNRNHGMLFQTGYEEIAKRILNWLELISN
jgi:pimeloyl-ACP methyl ester carboxylesterase